MPAMRPNMRSSGVATAVAIVSGLAPGRAAETVIVGYSTSGSVATGRKGKARAPNRNKPMLSREVATGRLINGAEIFTVCRRLRFAFAPGHLEKAPQFSSLSRPIAPRGLFLRVVL